MRTLLCALALALAALAAAERAEGSLYELGVKGQDGAGKTVGLDAFRGSPVLVSLFYSRCPSACPLLVAELKRVLASLPEAERARTKVLLVSLDPDFDEPVRLAALAEAHVLAPEQWKLVRVPEEDVRRLAGVLGIRYRKMKDGTIDHSTAIGVLDADGALVGRVDGIGDPTDDTLAKALLAELR